MGEIAEMMLDGTMCEGCGEFLGGDVPGYPRYCAGCGEDGGAADYSNHDQHHRGQLRAGRDTPCPDCGKMCRGEHGVAEHRRAKHPA